jgi:arsenate reductase
MSETPVNVLFLCRGNSARSIMGEAILNRLGGPRVTAFSAGNDPAGSIHPSTIAVLGERGYLSEGLTSKSWDVFSRSDAPQMDLVITLCDEQAAEACPVWPGRPARAHWSLPDPVKSSEEHDDARAPFREARESLEARIRTLLDRLGQTPRIERATLEKAALEA